MIEVGTRLQNNETGVIVTVVETTNWIELSIPPIWKLKWVFYDTPAKNNVTCKRRCRVSADRIYPLPADGRARKKGYTVVPAFDPGVRSSTYA
jgi:hypothetical protein